MSPTTGQVDRVSTIKIHIRNLPDEPTEEELRAIFEPYGRVVECELFHKKSFAFVRMEDEASGARAISVLNGRMVRGSTVVVQKSNQMDQGPKIASVRMAVKNIPASLNAAGLRELFKKYGLVLSAEISNGVGTVNLEAMADFRTAIMEVNGFMYDGQCLSVEPFMNTAVTYAPLPPSQPPRPPPPPPPTKSKPTPLMGEFHPRPHGSSNQPQPPMMQPFIPNPQNHAYGQEEQQTEYNESSYYNTPYEYEETEGNYYGEYEDTEEVEEDYSEYEYEQASFEEPPPWQGPEGRVPRDPHSHMDMMGYPPRPMGFRPPMGRGMLRPPFRPPMLGPGQPRHPRPLFSNPMMQSQPPRPLFAPRMAGPRIQQPTSQVAIEPLFLRRKEILQSANNPNSYGRNEYYEDIPLDHPPPPSLLPPPPPPPPPQYPQQKNAKPPSLFDNLIGDEILNGGSGFESPPVNSGLLNNSKPQSLFDDFYAEQSPSQYHPERAGFGVSNNVRPSPLLRNPAQAPMGGRRLPPPLFQGNRPIKRSVPPADPGQPFQVPGMIPPGVFQPPKKYFANRPRAPVKKKKKTEPAPEPPIPVEPQRPVPDFQAQNRLLPKGAVLRPFPPPLMNQNAGFPEGQYQYQPWE